MKLSARDQMIAAGILIGIVAVAFIVLLVVPQFGSLSRLDSDMSKAEPTSRRRTSCSPRARRRSRRPPRRRRGSRGSTTRSRTPPRWPR